MSQAFKRCEGNVHNVMTGGACEARDKTGATGVVIGMAPVWVPITPGWRTPLVHTNLLNWGAEEVQRRICIYQIGFVGEEILNPGLLKLCDFRKVEIADLHRRNHHFEGLLTRGAYSRTEEIDVA